MKKICIGLMAVIMALTAVCQEKNENVFSYKVGEYEVVLLSEGQGNGNSKILIGATPEMMEKTIPDGTFPNAVNTFLVKTPGKVYLIDTGFGRNLAKNMASVGVTPEQIETVIITHMHGDHVGGLLKDGAVAFPNVTVIVSDNERRYWVNEKKQEAAMDIVKQYGDKIQVIMPEKLGEKKGDGIFFIEAYGHTPGHTACLIQSGKERLMIWADLTHAMAIQMPYPDVSVTYDTDPVMAAESRKQILEFVTKHKIPVAGMHIAYPAMGEVEANGEGGYRFIPFR